MSYSNNSNLLIIGFIPSMTCFAESDIKKMQEFEPDIVHIIGISGSENWLKDINTEFKTVNIIECDEISIHKLKPCFYRDLENHAFNILYDYFIDKKMFMEAFICTRFLNNDLMKQKKYILASINEMVEKVTETIHNNLLVGAKEANVHQEESNIEHENKKILILCPWKLITPSIFGNLISNFNYEATELEFSDPLVLVLDIDDINTHKVSLANLINTKGIIDEDIYNHTLSILVKIWILENSQKTKLDNCADTKIFCLNIIIQYLYKNKRIHDIYEVWEFYKSEIDTSNVDSSYIFLYYSKYLSHIGMLDEAAKFLLEATKINKELDENIKNIISSKTKEEHINN